MKNMKRKKHPFNGMTFRLAGIDYDLGIKNEVAGIQSFAIALSNFIAKNISLAYDTWDIAQQTAKALKLDGKPIFTDTSIDAVEGEAKPGSYAAFYELIAKWDHMAIDEIAFVEALFKECIAFIENRYDIEVYVEAHQYAGFAKQTVEDFEFSNAEALVEINQFVKRFEGRVPEDFNQNGYLNGTYVPLEGEFIVAAETVDTAVKSTVKRLMAVVSLHLLKGGWPQDLFCQVSLSTNLKTGKPQWVVKYSAIEFEDICCWPITFTFQAWEPARFDCWGVVPQEKHREYFKMRIMEAIEQAKANR